MSPAKALRLSLARAAEDLWDVAAAASGIAVAEETLEQAVDSLSEDGLILLLEGPEGLIGAAQLPYGIVAGLVEAQTMGRISPMAPDPRRLTRTDAAMVAPLIDDMMERFDALLDEEGVAPWARGYRFGTMMDSARMLSLALRATDFHTIRFSLDLAALREGEAMIMLPLRELAVQASVSGDGAIGRSGALEAQILQAPTELRAVLHRLSMPLSEVSGLKPGTVLQVPRDALRRTEVETGSGSVIGATHLGQMNGMRAVRMRLPGRPDAQGAVAAAAGPGAAGGEVSARAPDPAELPMSAPLPDLPDLPAMADPLPVEPSVPVSAPEEDLLGDLPDLGDLPGMHDEGELPDIGLMPVADLPSLD